MKFGEYFFFTTQFRAPLESFNFELRLDYTQIDIATGMLPSADVASSMRRIFLSLAVISYSVQWICFV